MQDIAAATRTGAATTVLEGISSGLESSVWALIAVAVAIGGAIALGGGNFKFSTYLVALAGIGMLSTTAIIVAEDTFGPVADNAAGIAEMSGHFEGEPERILVRLDAVGNTTKAVTKGFAIGSAVIAAVALFASYGETIIQQIGGALPKRFESLNQSFPINVADPKVFIGLLVGGSIAFIFSSLAIRAVSPHRRSGRGGGSPAIRRRQDHERREEAGLRALHRHLHGRLAPRAVQSRHHRGADPGRHRLRDRPHRARRVPRLGVIVTGQLMANFLSNAGGAWDNAKKYIEDGAEGGKGSEAHKAAVIGDTIGDPFKDTAGPALNPLIKVMNLVSLLILPAIIKVYDKGKLETFQQHPKGPALIIAGAALIVVLGAIVYAKKADAPA